MAETSEMVERVRNAIDAAWMSWATGVGRQENHGDVPVELLARAAIQAMREPTEAMLRASEREWDGRMCHRSTNAYQAMIDAALPSPDTGPSHA